jgi:hypothetical protein
MSRSNGFEQSTRLQIEPLSISVSIVSTKELIAKEIEQVPQPLLDEVLDFVRFLKGKRLEDASESSLLAESSLRKDWLKPEEDDAWRNL